MLWWLETIKDRKKSQNVVRTLATHTAAPGVLNFRSYQILTSSVIYY